MAFDVVTIGNYTQDTIVTPGGTRRVDGGGFAYAAHAARAAGRRVAAVTRLAQADACVLEPLRRAGVEVFAHQSPQSTRLRLEYRSANLDERVVTVTSAADAIAPEHVAPLESEAFVVNASLRGEVPLAVLESLRAKGAFLGLDVQGFVRVAAADGRLVHERWEEMGRVLPMVDALKTDAVEAEFLTGRSDLREAASALAALGAREVVLTHAGGVLVLAGGSWHEAAFRPLAVRGRSGRGDTCLGAYVSMRLSAPAAEATRWAAAVTSLKLEVEGPVRSTPEDVAARLRQGG